MNWEKILYLIPVVATVAVMIVDGPMMFIGLILFFIIYLAAAFLLERLVSVKKK